MNLLHKGWRSLLSNILFRAVKDYKECLLLEKRDDLAAQKTKKECEEFFRSDWADEIFGLLNINIDPEKLIEKLKAENNGTN